MAFTYKGLKAELSRHLVTEEELNRQMERLRQQTPRIAVVDDRPTERGDEVVLDYAGFCDGVQFEGGTAQNQTLVLGSGMFIPGFEEQLLDKVPGEEVTVKVNFPEQYHSQELAGKAAEFKCVIRQIRIKSAYEEDDLFAQEVGGCQTLAEMREKLAESLQSYTDERGEMDLQDRLLRQAADTLEVSFTAEQLEQAVAEQMQNLEAQLQQQGLNLDMYCGFLKTTPEDLRKEAEPSARVALQISAAIDRIVELENLEAEPKEISDAYALICRQNNMTMEQLEPYCDEEFQKAVRKSVLTGKVMALIREAAEITVV